jgi:hypothetical protein
MFPFALRKNANGREGYWSESIAVGSRDFVEETQRALGTEVCGRRVEEKDAFQLTLESSDGQ